MTEGSFPSFRERRDKKPRNSTTESMSSWQPLLLLLLPHLQPPHPFFFYLPFTLFFFCFRARLRRYMWPRRRRSRSGGRNPRVRQDGISADSVDPDTLQRLHTQTHTHTICMIYILQLSGPIIEMPRQFIVPLLCSSPLYFLPFFLFFFWFHHRSWLTHNCTDTHTHTLNGRQFMR